MNILNLSGALIIGTRRKIKTLIGALGFGEDIGKANSNWHPSDCQSK